MPKSSRRPATKHFVFVSASPKPDPRPKRINCTVTGGPKRKDLFSEHELAFDPYGWPNYRLIFYLTYLEHQYRCYACITSIKYRSRQNRDSFNLGGYIQFAMPGERTPQIRKFTGHFSTKSAQGRFYIYVEPTAVEKTRVHSDFEQK